MGKILDEDLIYEILSVVEEIPAGKVASYGQIARLIGWDKKFEACRKSFKHGRILWEISLPQSCESCRPYCTRMERTEGTSGRRRCGI